MKKVILSLAASILTVFGLTAIAGFAPANAASVICPGESAPRVNSLAECNSGTNNISGGNNQNNLMATITRAINVIVGVVGLVAVIMIIVGGINYTISQGDSSKVQKAQKTIMYGVVGLIVAILAYAIVNFVLTSLFTN